MSSALTPVPSNGQTAHAVLEPEQVGAAAAARLAGVSQATWWRLHASGRVPRPNKLGGRTLWRVRELREWVEAGCPDRKTWETLIAVQRSPTTVRR
jgi:predicted DNA-binding transcriptional regulator AlpA